MRKSGNVLCENRQKVCEKWKIGVFAFFHSTETSDRSKTLSKLVITEGSRGAGRHGCGYE